MGKAIARWTRAYWEGFVSYARIILMASAAALVTACATNSSPFVWSPALEISADEAAVINAECEVAALQARADDAAVRATPTYQYNRRMYGLDAVIRDAMARGEANAANRVVIRSRCYATRGFVLVELTDDEFAVWRSIRSDAERQAYARQLLAADPTRVSLGTRKWAEESSPLPAEQ